MRKIILFILPIFSVSLYGQNAKWQLSLQVQPEMTFYKDSYRWFGKNNEKSTLNAGAVAGIQYNINKRFFASAGIGFISRKLVTANNLNQASLPPPRQSFTLELVTTESVSYRVISVPVNIGYNVLATDRFKGFVTTGFSGNYLLNTYYKSNFSRYDGAYKKNYWQGYTLCLGLGTDIKLTKKLSASSSLSYALKHQVKKDEYLFSQEDGGLTLGHNFLSLGIGVKFQL